AAHFDESSLPISTGPGVLLLGVGSGGAPEPRRQAGLPGCHAIEEESLLAESRLELVQPAGLRVVASEEHPTDPCGVAGLQEIEHEDLLARDLVDAEHADLAGRGRHARTLDGPRQPGHPAESVAEDLIAACERDLEKALGTRVPL